MRDLRSWFTCFPSVVPVGKESAVSVVPRDNSRRFRGDVEYEMCVLAIGEDQESYHSPLSYEHPVTVEKGCLCFIHTFEREQEYEVRFRVKGQTESHIVSLYAVEEDLYRLRPLKGELHTHTYYSDGNDGFTVTPADYREEGFDFVSITDHNRRYTSVLAADLYKDVKLGLCLIPGEEVHTPGSLLHIVHAGGKESVAAKYVDHPEEFRAEVDVIEASLPDTVPALYRRRLAMAKWACGKIHDAEGIAIFPHPFWRPRAYNVTEEFCDLLFDEKIFDAFELFNGIEDRYNNLQVGLWQQQLIKGNPIPVVGSSDSHNHDAAVNGTARRFTLVFARDNTTEAILDAIRKGNSVAGFIPLGQRNEGGTVPFADGTVQFFSTQFRLVKFAHFLYRTYFHETRRLCFGEGVLMRRYAEGEDVGETLSSLADTVSEFYRKFYGITPAPSVPSHIEAILDTGLELQRKGPTTKGSSLIGNTRRE